jgi:hypothetical protein
LLRDTRESNDVREFVFGVISGRAKLLTAFQWHATMKGIRVIEDKNYRFDKIRDLLKKIECALNLAQQSGQESTHKSLYRLIQSLLSQRANYVMIKMSENTSHFRIKKGEIEIEYSGKPEEVNERYKEALSWIERSIAPPTHIVKAPHEQKSKEPGAGSGRGGQRSPIVSKGIDKIISEGFLDKAKKTSEVLEELRRKVVPGTTIYNVGEALKRKSKKGVLDRIRGAGTEYSYIKKETAKKA